MKTYRESFESTLSLVNPNDKYRPAILATMYSIVGMFLTKHPITLGGQQIDLRTNFGLCMASGFGKSNFKNAIIDACKLTGLEYAMPTSLHAEHLVGKVVYERKKNAQGDYEDVRVELRGYFEDDVIIKDDALPLLNERSTTYERARGYFLDALDVYPYNEVEKMQVDLGRKEKLVYPAKSTFVYLFQPSEQIVERHLTSGLFRRALALRIDLLEEEKEEILNGMLKPKPKPEPEAWHKILRTLRELRELKVKPLNPKTLDLFARIGGKLLDREEPLLDNLATDNVKNLAKLTYINALLRTIEEDKLDSDPQWGIDINEPDSWGKGILEVEVEESDIKQACRDYNVIIKAVKNFVYGNKYVDLHEVERAMIGYLKKLGATSFDESNLSVGDFKGYMEKYFKDKYSSHSIKYHYDKLRNADVIEMKQVDNTATRVWLKKKGWGVRSRR